MLGAIGPNQYFDLAVTFRASTFIGVLFLVDVNTSVDIATFKKNAQKVFGRFHVRARPEFVPELHGIGADCRSHIKRSVARYPTAGRLE